MSTSSLHTTTTTPMPVDKNPSSRPSKTNDFNTNPGQNPHQKSHHHQNEVPGPTAPCPDPQNRRSMFHSLVQHPPLHLLKPQPLA
ncbi:hypothetical protein SLA2020_434440 [Shorea laevis]